MSSPTQFKLNLKRYGEKLGADSGKLARNLTLLGMRELVKRTPVDTGRAQNGWQLGIGSAPSGQGGGGLAAAVRLKLVHGPQVESLWLTNNVPYIVPLERGGSDQAPNGMMKLTVNRLRQALASEWRRFRRQAR
jgi:hypothetical protein